MLEGLIERVEGELTEKQRRMVMVAVPPATAAELSKRHGSASGYTIGCFARRSPLFGVKSRASNHTAIWELTELGHALRARLSS